MHPYLFFFKIGSMIKYAAYHFDSVYLIVLIILHMGMPHEICKFIGHNDFFGLFRAKIKKFYIISIALFEFYLFQWQIFHEMAVALTCSNNPFFCHGSCSILQRMQLANSIQCSQVEVILIVVLRIVHVHFQNSVRLFGQHGKQFRFLDKIYDLEIIFEEFLQISSKVRAKALLVGWHHLFIRLASHLQQTQKLQKQSISVYIDIINKSKLLIDAIVYEFYYILLMNSKISFYSFKDTQNNVTTRKFRKDKQSYFQQFQKQRIQQRLKERQVSNKRRAASYSILVRSEQEKQLLSFLQLPKLNNSKSKKKRRSQSKDSFQNAEIISKTPLQKILSNKSKFMKTYFSRLHKYEQNHRIQQVKHAFPEIMLQDWTIKGYLIGDHILLKAFHISGRERYLKYKYSKYIAEIKTSYEEFVKQKFQEYILASYAI